MHLLHADAHNHDTRRENNTTKLFAIYKKVSDHFHHWRIKLNNALCIPQEKKNLSLKTFQVKI